MIPRMIFIGGIGVMMHLMGWTVATYQYWIMAILISLFGIFCYNQGLKGE